MEGDPAPDRYPDRRHLLVADPDAGVGRSARRAQPVRRDGADQNLLQVSKVSVKIASGGKAREGDDRVGHELAGAVIGDISTALDGDDVNAPRAKLPLGHAEALRASCASDREDRVVLDEVDRVAARFRGSGYDGAVLKLERRPVRDSSQVVRRDGRGHSALRWNRAASSRGLRAAP